MNSIFELVLYEYIFRNSTWQTSVSTVKVQHILYLWNDDYLRFQIFSGMTVIVNLDYSVPGLVVADEKKKKVKVASLDGMWTWSTHCEGSVFIHVTTKYQLAYNCTNYLSTRSSIYKIIAE